MKLIFLRSQRLITVCFSTTNFLYNFSGLISYIEYTVKCSWIGWLYWYWTSHGNECSACLVGWVDIGKALCHYAVYSVHICMSWKMAFILFLFSGLGTSCVGIILFCPFTAILFDTVREHSIFLFLQRFLSYLVSLLGIFPWVLKNN